MHIPPQEPQAPQAPATGIGVSVQGAPARELPLPITPREVEAVRERRSELSRQLTSAANRREELAEEFAATPVSDAVVREGLAERIAVLDERIVKLEQDMAATGRQLTNAPSSALVPEDVPPWERMSTDQLTGISIVFTIFVLFPMVIALANIMWRRMSTPRLKRDKAEVERMDRLEQAVDSIAIEVERIGEGQRFMTRLLTESNGMAALAGGERAADAVPRARGQKD